MLQDLLTTAAVIGTLRVRIKIKTKYAWFDYYFL